MERAIKKLLKLVRQLEELVKAIISILGWIYILIALFEGGGG